MGKNNGKRKINYKQVYGGTDPQDIKRCKYSGNSVDPTGRGLISFIFKIPKIRLFPLVLLKFELA